MISNHICKSIAISERNTYFLSDKGFIYFCGVISDKSSFINPNAIIYAKTPELIERQLNFNDIYIKNKISVAINDSSIFRLNFCDVENEYMSNLYNYYAFDYNISYKTIEVKELREALNKFKSFYRNYRKYIFNLKPKFYKIGNYL